VPVDFVVEAMTALFSDEAATGRTLQLADPEPLTTFGLFETIARALVGRGSRVAIPPTVVRTGLRLPLAERVTGLPPAAVPYFFINQTYDTAIAREMLEPHGVRCPPFPGYVRALIEFVKQHPKL